MTTSEVTFDAGGDAVGVAPEVVGQIGNGLAFNGDGTITLTSGVVVPTTEAPYQSISVTLSNQVCLINLYTKSTNVPVLDPGEIASDPYPRYENINPCFVDLYVDGNPSPVVGGVYVRQGSLIVRDVYLGFVGDLAVIDTSGAAEDPAGVPPRLPPKYLRTQAQREEFPLSDGDQAPASIAGTIPGMGTRWVLTYLPPGTYVPGYPPAG